jgi:hypothetical protein
LRSLHGVRQALAGFGLTAFGQQQFDQLARRTDHQCHAAIGLATLDQCLQARLGLARALQHAIEQRLLQLDARAARVKLRCGGGQLAAVGLAQAQQPGLGQVCAPWAIQSSHFTRVIMAR